MIMQIFSGVFRRTMRRPAVVVVSALTLAIGIGAVVAGFSVLKGVVLNPLPYPDAGQLAYVFRQQPPVMRGPTSREIFLEMASDRQEGFALAGFARDSFTLRDTQSAERVNGIEVSEGFFDILGLPPAVGRHLAANDQDPAEPFAAVISHRLWQERYGGTQDVLGKQIYLNGIAHTVVGVAHSDMNIPVGADVWRPARFAVSDNNGNYIHLLARLQPGGSLQSLSDWSTAHAAQWEARDPGSYRDLSFTAFEVADWHIRGVRDNLWLIFGAVGLVLLIACANVANLLLTQTLARSREIATHAALGAPQRRLAMMALSESLVIAVFGLIGGLLLAGGALRILRSEAATFMPRAEYIQLDSGVVIFAVGVTLLTAMLCGLLPAMFARRVNLSEVLQSGSKQSSGSGSQAWRKSLVTGEIAMCTSLVVAAMLLVTTVQRLTDVDPGFDTGRLLSAQVVLAPEGEPETWEEYAAQQQQFVRAVSEELATLPGVSSVGVIDTLPVTGTNHWNGNIALAGETYPDGRGPVAEFRFVDASYFKTLGLAILAGRNFSESETGPPRVLVNQAFVDRIGKGRELVGETVQAIGMELEIIGVASNARQWSLSHDSDPEIYFLYGQTPAPFETTLVLRTESEPLALAQLLRETVQRVNADVPVYNVRTMEQIVERSYAQRNFVMQLLLAFGAAALAIAGIGLYAVLSYAVSQRTRDIGVQVALGATASQVMSGVMREGLVLAFIGILAGCAIALFAARLMGSLVYGVSFHEPMVYASAALVLGITALAASSIPAWRASRVTPMQALRHE